MRSFPRVECKDCPKGLEMCHNRPCWGSVEEFAAIIDQGHAHELMLDYWSSDSLVGHEIKVLCGANNGHGGGHAGLSPKGTCALLVDGKCSINAIKPSEGAWACCKDSESKFDTQHKWKKELALDWDSPKGRALVKKWKAIVGLKGERPVPGLADEMEAMLNILGIK